MVVMSTLPGEPSRRDNGIEAEAYVLLRTVDRGLASAVLDALRTAEIAAYTTTPDDASLSSRDLWVAATAAGEARRIAARVQWEQGRVQLEPADVEARFAALIEGFDGPSQVPARDDPGPDRTPGAPSATEPALPPAAGTAWRSPTSDVSSLDDPPDDPDDHFEPPPVGPLRRPTRRSWLGIVLIAVGCAMLFFPALVGLDSTTALLLGVLGIGGGVGVLVLGLRSDRDDFDDGAVV